MGRRICFFIVIVVAVSTVGCAPPIGSVGSSGSVFHDALWANPNRVVYELYDRFQRNSDLRVFVSYRGAVQIIPTEEVMISIDEDPDNPDVEPIVLEDEDYPLQTPGRKLVIVRYGDDEDYYSIDVRNPGIGGP